jgi:hypothetical protein
VACCWGLKIFVNKKRSCSVSKKAIDLTGHGHGNGHPALVGHVGLGVALVDDLAGTVFATSALAGNAQFKLDVVKALALAGVQSNLFLGHAAANANNHGKSGELKLMSGF